MGTRGIPYSKAHARTDSIEVEIMNPIKKEVVIGNCRLLLGDCLEIMPLLNNFSAVWTDPPYNVGKDYGSYKDNLEHFDYLQWCDSWISKLEKLSDNIAIFAPKIHFRWFWNRLPEHHPVICGWTPEGCIRSNFVHQYSPILLPKKPKNRCKDFWLNVQMSGLGYFFKEEKFDHPGTTSLDMTRRVLGAIADQGDNIFDPFMGTGTSAVVSIEKGYSFVGIELNENYFNIACERVKNSYMQPDLFIES